jgi:hypothetical protein
VAASDARKAEREDVAAQEVGAGVLDDRKAGPSKIESTRWSGLAAVGMKAGRARQERVTLAGGRVKNVESTDRFEARHIHRGL